MNAGTYMEMTPLWAMYGISTLFVIASIYGGVCLGRARGRGEGEEEAPAMGAVVGATLGLLAFMLAFTFGLAASRFDTRKELLLDEVNAIETTYLRAGLLPAPHCAEVRKLLVRYVDVRASVLRQPGNLQAAIRESDDLLGRIWPHAEALANEELKNADIVSLFVDSLNEMIDLHAKRITVAAYRIPPVIWLALLAVTVLSMMSVGYEFGQSGKANWQIALMLSLTFSAVILLIADLDRPGSGAVKVNQQPMIDLQARLRAAEK